VTIVTMMMIVTVVGTQASWKTLNRLPASGRFGYLSNHCPHFPHIKVCRFLSISGDFAGVPCVFRGDLGAWRGSWREILGTVMGTRREILELDFVGWEV